MNRTKARIGLALSGGGLRAAIFHLGVMQFLAEAKLFGRITSLSSVSGASMCIGAIFAVNGNKWPGEEDFLRHVQPGVRRLMQQRNIQTAALLRLPFSPKFWFNRAELLAKVLESKWGIKGSLQDLPLKPYWEINCTAFETGGRFRLRRDYIGEKSIGYVQNPELPISHMIAASAAFPALIGPYILRTDGMSFTRDKAGKQKKVETLGKYSLWDGGVYDNLGLEALHRIGKGIDGEIDFIIVSNASASIGHKSRGRPSVNLRRLLEISMSQVDSLRSKEFFSSIVRKKKGLYIKIGNTSEDIANFIGRADKARSLGGLSREDAAKVRDYPTTLSAPSKANFELIFRHGYENAKCVYEWGLNQ